MQFLDKHAGLRMICENVIMKYDNIITASPSKFFGTVSCSLKLQWLSVTKHFLTNSSTMTMFGIEFLQSFDEEGQWKINEIKHFYLSPKCTHSGKRDCQYHSGLYDNGSNTEGVFFLRSSFDQ